MQTLIIRDATAADVPTITAIYADEVLHGTATFDLVPPDEAYLAKRMQVLTERGYPDLVATRADAVVGYAYGGPYRERAAYDNTVEDSIYLARDARGQGVGRMMLKALIDECTKRDYRQMLAVIGDNRNAASIALHRAEGFADAGSLKNVGFKHGLWLDAVLMQLTLGRGATEKPSR